MASHDSLLLILFLGGCGSCDCILLYEIRTLIEMGFTPQSPLGHRYVCSLIDFLHSGVFIFRQRRKVSVQIVGHMVVHQDVSQKRNGLFLVFHLKINLLKDFVTVDSSESLAEMDELPIIQVLNLTEILEYLHHMDHILLRIHWKVR